MWSSNFQAAVFTVAVTILWNEGGECTTGYLNNREKVVEDTQMQNYPTTFLQNFFRTTCNGKEMITGCRAYEGGTCWSPTIIPGALCIRGCKCKKGLMRNSEGSCVAVRECDTKIKPDGHIEPRVFLGQR